MQYFKLFQKNELSTRAPVRVEKLEREFSKQDTCPVLNMPLCSILKSCVIVVCICGSVCCFKCSVEPTFSFNKSSKAAF